MSVVVALLAGVGILLWPERFGWRRLALLRRVTYAQPRLGAPAASPSAVVPRTAAGSVPASAPGWVEVLVPRSSRGWWGRGLAGRPEPGVNPQDVLSLLESIAPALEAGLAPASALQIAAEARSGSGRPDTLAALASDLASAAAEGAPLGSLWREAAEAQGSGELLLLSQAWSLTEDLGVRLAQAVRTTAALLEARIAHERRLAGAVAGGRL